ncbi:uncharacterized protein BYT42DRAFT_589155 [Radiomyces spectabilis]|uniref:uncharacterized protein n=1 Tax=Radiomyces spectabilis TaxID=64574 RepID=UPI00221EE1BC|nr:uncharacterized protein BYT42DRAFT_589155 [Radiomyces spectabilis]KAI8365205.1 hypothetical protein BYT42DRAFT_589155 [Radiomyces spectabilis]
MDTPSRRLYMAATTPPREENRSTNQKETINELARTLKARLQFARLKVQSGMADKDFQEVEDVFSKDPESDQTGRQFPLTPASPPHIRKRIRRSSGYDSEDDQQEAAAARTIMMLSSSGSPRPRMKRPLQEDPPGFRRRYRPNIFEEDKEEYPPSFYDYVAQDPDYERRSRIVGRNLPRLTVDQRDQPASSPYLHPPPYTTYSNPAPYYHYSPYNTPTPYHHSSPHLPPLQTHPPSYRPSHFAYSSPHTMSRPSR